MLGIKWKQRTQGEKKHEFSVCSKRQYVTLRSQGGKRSSTENQREMSQGLCTSSRALNMIMTTEWYFSPHPEFLVRLDTILDLLEVVS